MVPHSGLAGTPFIHGAMMDCTLPRCPYFDTVWAAAGQCHVLPPLWPLNRRNYHAVPPRKSSDRAQATMDHRPLMRGMSRANTRCEYGK
jgi:hypothetical protein